MARPAVEALAFMLTYEVEPQVHVGGSRNSLRHEIVRHVGTVQSGTDRKSLGSRGVF